ncbi:MAG: PDZ domain-containing protein [Hydrogenophaga sp.]
MTTVTTPAPAPRPRATGTPEDARRHMVRGMAAIEMARSDAELARAEDEFRLATEIDPTLAAAWFNLGAVQSRMGQLEEAIASYNRYLTLSPNAEDAPRVRDEVIKLQYRQEQVAKVHARAGAWVAEDGAFYTVTVEADHLRLKGFRRPVPADEVLAVYPPIGPHPLEPGERIEYLLSARGARVTGRWTREPLPRGKCTVPAETTDVEGELDDRAGTLVLLHIRTLYRAATQFSLMSDDYCREVTVTGTKKVEERIYGPLPKGGLGVVLAGLGEWWFEGFEDTGTHGWQGRLGVSFAADSAAHAAGLRDKDEILTIDGVAVRTLTAGEAVRRLRGEPGSSVTLTVARKGHNEPITVVMDRVVLEHPRHN